MPFDPPRTLTPSKVTAFTNCPLAFRFSVIERRPEPPSPHAVKGTLVHAALEGLFWNHAAPARTRAAAGHELAQAWAALATDPEFVELALDETAATAFLADADKLIDNYFRLEDPTQVHTIGVELGVEIQEDGLRMRGIIDRLDIGPDGSLTVVDYKTGRAPSERYEQGKMGGVQTYAFLCEKVLGRAPVEVRLLHLRDPVAISAVATPQTLRGQQRRTSAVWNAITRACTTEDFRPKVGPLCQFCHFKPSCPAFGAASGSGSGSASGAAPGSGPNSGDVVGVGASGLGASGVSASDVASAITTSDVLTLNANTAPVDAAGVTSGAA